MADDAAKQGIPEMTTPNSDGTNAKGQPCGLVRQIRQRSEHKETRRINYGAVTAGAACAVFLLLVEIATPFVDKLSSIEFTLAAVSRYGIALIIGAVLGCLIFFGYAKFSRLSRRLGVKSINLDLPIIGNIEIGLDPPHRSAAWQIYVEMTTRISTQPLYETSQSGTDLAGGRLDEALTSFYQHFAIIREQMKAAGPTPDYALPSATVPFEHLAEKLLNQEFRPCTARWHPRRELWNEVGLAESKWPLARLCRLDLEATRLRALDYAIGFGKLGDANETDLAVLRLAYDTGAKVWRDAYKRELPEHDLGPTEEPHLTPLACIAAKEIGIEASLPAGVEAAARAAYFGALSSLPIIPQEDRRCGQALPSVVAGIRLAVQALRRGLREMPAMPPVSDSDTSPPLEQLIIDALNPARQALALLGGGPTPEATEQAWTILADAVTEVSGKLAILGAAIGADPGETGSG